MSSVNERTIIVDNGSWKVRAGFSTGSRRLFFSPLISRFKDRKSSETFLYCGDDVFLDSVTKSSARRPSDQNVVVNFEAMESLLDYTFLNLGLDTHANDITPRLLLSESLLNVQYPRKRMMELLFEAYSIPSLAFGVDSLLSFIRNKGSTGLVISCGHSFSHIIPVYEGVPLLPSAARLNWGGARSVSYTADMLALKYPLAMRKMSKYQAENILVSQCFVAPDYGRAAGLLTGASSFGLLGREVRMVSNLSIPTDLTTSKDLAAKEVIQQNTQDTTQSIDATSGLMARKEVANALDAEVRDNAMRQRDLIISKLISLEKDSSDASIRRQAANKARMRDIAFLASDNKGDTSQKLSSRSRSTKIREEQDDLFGIDDNDWRIYQDLKNTGANETFLADVRDLVKDLETIQRQMSSSGIDAVSFRRVRYPKTLSLFWGDESTINNNLTLNLERMKCLEPFFNPSIAGVDSAGLPELAAHLLKTELGSISRTLAADIFVTGGCCLSEGFESRIAESITALLPENHPVHVRSASNPIWDPWFGAAYQADYGNTSAWIGKSEWQEGGADYCLERMRRANSLSK